MEEKIAKAPSPFRDWIVWIALFILPLLFYPRVVSSTWISNSDVHALLEFWAGLIALLTAATVLIHFFATRRRFFLMISLGFTLQGAEDLVHAIYSFSRIWPTEYTGIADFVPGTYVAGRLILVICLILALYLEKKGSVAKNTKKEAILYNTAGFLLAIAATVIIINSPLPHFILLGQIISRPVDFVAALIYLITFFLFAKTYRREEHHTPFMWSMITSVIFGCVAQIYMVHSQSLYDAQFDISHALKLFSYIFPIFGIAIGTFFMYTKEKALTHDPSERVKEFDCLYNFSRIAQQPGISLKQIYKELIKIIPPSWQYPEITRVKLVVNGDEFKSDNFKTSKWKQSADIKLEGEKAGSIEVYYAEEKPGAYEGPFLKEERNLIEAIAGQIARIIRYRKTNEEIQTLKQRMEFILGATKTGLDIIDSDFNMVYIDPVWQTVYGDHKGKKCYEYFNSRKTICPACGILKALKTKHPVVTEVILSKEGNRPVQVMTFPFQNDNGKWMVAEVNVDIAERKRSEKKLKEAQAKLIQADKMASLGTLGAGIAHQINQPLTGIRAFTQVLLEQIDKDSPFYKNLKRIEEQTGYIRDIISNISGFAFAGKLRKIPIDINKPIKKALELLSEQLKLHNIKLVEKLGSGIPKVFADANQMQQIFISFIVNAKEAMDNLSKERKKTLTITTSVAVDKKHIGITFSNTGGSISKEVINRIFEPFFTSKGPGSTGLGLSVAYEIVRGHGGNIEVDSKPGKGTTFKMILPIYVEEK